MNAQIEAGSAVNNIPEVNRVMQESLEVQSRAQKALEAVTGLSDDFSGEGVTPISQSDNPLPAAPLDVISMRLTVANAIIGELQGTVYRLRAKLFGDRPPTPQSHSESAAARALAGQLEADAVRGLGPLR